MVSGCGSADTSGHYTVTTAPFTIKADRTINPGYSDTLCIQCTNGDQTIDYDGLIVTVAPDPCLTSLSAATTTPSNPSTYPYDGVTTT